MDPTLSKIDRFLQCFFHLDFAFMFTYSFFTQDNSENVSQDQTEAGRAFEPEIDPKRVPFYKVLQLLLLFAFFFLVLGCFLFQRSISTTIHWTGIR